MQAHARFVSLLKTYDLGEIAKAGLRDPTCKVVSLGHQGLTSMLQLSALCRARQQQPAAEGLGALFLQQLLLRRPSLSPAAAPPGHPV